MGKWIRMLYVTLAWLFPVAMHVQVFFVGLSLFTGQAFWSIHSSAKRLAWLVLGVYLIQAEVFASIRAV
jgi:hypothetical protein